jgi:hypothetical protein
VTLLSRQKNREGLSWFARRASTWLLKKVRERRSVKGQALDETCKPSRNWKKRDLDDVGVGIAIHPCFIFDHHHLDGRNLVLNVATTV